MTDQPLAPTAPPQHPTPQSLSELFWAFTWLALQGFGGVLAVVQRVLVDKKQWLTREQFVEDWAVAQVPVSYTHLDVDKIQVLAPGVEFFLRALW